MPWPITGAIHYHAQLGLSDKGRAIICCLFEGRLTRELLDIHELINFLGHNHEVGILRPNKKPS